MCMCGMMLTMGYFNRDSNNRSGRDNRGGGRDFSPRGGSSFGRSGRDSGPREMFKTVCSNCGKECEVPFRPTSGKPVYCSDCFEKMGGRNSDGGRPERNDRPERRDRPSFERNDRSHTPMADYSKQLSELNAKLDKIILLLTPKIEKTVIEDTIAMPVVNETKEPKLVKTSKVKKDSKK